MEFAKHLILSQEAQRANSRPKVKRCPFRKLWEFALSCDAGFLRNASLFPFFEERHHCPEFCAHPLDRLILRFFAHAEELLAACSVFVEPRAGKFTRLYF